MGQVCCVEMYIYEKKKSLVHHYCLCTQNTTWIFSLSHDIFPSLHYGPYVCLLHLYEWSLKILLKHVEDFAQTLPPLWNFCTYSFPARCFPIPPCSFSPTNIPLSLSHRCYVPIFILSPHLSPRPLLLNLGFALESPVGI